MKFQIEAAKRLAETTEVEAADATDAGKALVLLESYFGKATKRETNPGYYQSVIWKTKEFDGRFTLNIARGNNLDLYMEVKYKGSNYQLRAFGGTFEKFQKDFKAEIRGLLQGIRSDIKVFEKRLEDIKALEEKLSKD